MNTFSLIILAAIILNLGLQWWLAQRHIAHVSNHKDNVPKEFIATVNLADHRKAAEYTVAKTRFSNVEHIIDAMLLILWTLGGGLALIDAWISGLGSGQFVSGIVFIILVLLVKTGLEAPIGAYRTFVLEQKFGFNRTSAVTFLTDLLKEAALLAILGAPLAAAMLWLMTNAGSHWWLYGWTTWMSFSVFMMWAYPTLIAPIFNKFTPLATGDLRAKIEALLHRNGFLSSGIFVMDGSARSAHGNAYFTGLGANKRIVFFDTLISELNPDELESVLAHELGHFKCKHVVKQLALMSALSLAGFALLGWLSSKDWFFAGLGMSQPSAHSALILFLFITPLIGAALHPVLAALSRRYEFEADAFAAKQSDANALITALAKLYKENASTLTPDPIYSAYHDSHPPAPIRIAHLRQLSTA